MSKDKIVNIDDISNLDIVEDKIREKNYDKAMNNGDDYNKNIMNENFKTYKDCII